MGTKKVARDAGKGTFVKKEYAQKNPKTTVVETIKTPRKK